MGSIDLVSPPECPACEGTGSNASDPLGVCSTCAGLGRFPDIERDTEPGMNFEVDVEPLTR